MRFTISGAATALLLASVAPAGAQMLTGTMVPGDIYQGFYVGVDVGGGFGDSTASNSYNGNTSKPKLDVSGPVGGIKGGYNWRLNPSWLVGLETDFEGSGLSSHSGQFLRNFPNGASATGGVSMNQDWQGSIRGRIGYNINPGWLWFVQGGFAYAQVNSSAFATLSGVPTVTGPQTYAFRGSKDGVQTGYTVGSGSEIAIAPQFGLVLEYRYSDLGSFSYNAPTRVASSPLLVNARNNINVDNTSHVFRIGLNYHFNAPPPPPPAPPAPPAPPPVAAKVFIVFFDWDKDSITPEGHAIIQQAADAYRAGAPVQIQVTGYTDRSGSPGYNQRLSERRANNVAKSLAALGVPKAQMVVSGRGENDNRVPTADGVREPQNRRVEIVSP